MAVVCIKVKDFGRKKYKLFFLKRMASEDLTPGDKILVDVDTALPDILIVSYLRNGKKFQGALLDSSKRYGLLIILFGHRSLQERVEI